MKKLCALLTLCFVVLISARATPPAVAITTPTDGADVTSLSAISGWVTNDVPVTSLRLTIRESGSGNGTNRWWNGTSWQLSPISLATTITGTNWTNAAGGALPPLNSGLAYEITANATDTLFNASSATITIHTTVEELTWDPGATHLGTQVKNSPHSLGGTFVYKIVTLGTTVGGWRTALNMTGGEADVYLSFGGVPSIGNYYFFSANPGSDGFVLHSSQFSESQEWYYLVNAAPGSTWNLVSGEPHVIDLGALPDAAASGNTNVTIGAEGWRFFRTVAPVNTLAWRLWLNGAGNDIHVKKDFIPLFTTYEMRQAGAILLVPDYLQDNQTYFVGVPGSPGQALKFQSKQQSITDVAFNSGQSGIAVNDYPYRTYRVPVPIDQIAWQVKTIPSAGNADVAIRRTKVPNEFNNDAYSEVAGAVQDSVTLVPPTLSDGTFYITVYGATNRTYALTNGEPTIPIRAFALTNVNDQPSLVGWRYYVVNDIPSQLGTLGWELILANQPPGTEIALRRNAVPGRWNYRNGGFGGGSQGYVDYSVTDGWLQRPGHQADIWYIGVYQGGANLGPFTLDTHAIAPRTVAFNNFTTNVSSLPLGKWQYLRIDVPADAQGWDLRIPTFANGNPHLTVSRDVLPGAGTYGIGFLSSDWPSGGYLTPGVDWTSYYYNPDGGNTDGKVMVATRNNPLKPGTYYVGVRDDQGPGPVSYTLASRGIGTNYAIGVSNLNFSGAGSTVTGTLNPREAAYYRFVVPPNQPNWKLRLTPTTGDALLIVLRDFLPNVANGYGEHEGYGRKLQKLGRDHYLLLPDGEDLLPGETNYLVVVGEGENPSAQNSRIGTNATTFTLESLGPLPVANLGALAAAPGSSISQHVTMEGGEVKLLKFTVAPNTPFLEIRMTNRVGNPSFALRAGTNAPWPHVPCCEFGSDQYGAEGGTFAGRREDHFSEFVTIANPPPGLYAVTVKAEDVSGYTYPSAEADLSVTVRGSTPLSFNNGSLAVAGQAPREWRFFSVTVPANADGWELRLANVSGGFPRMYARRDLLPDLAQGDLYIHGDDWLSGQQLAAPYLDWTERYRDADLSNRPYQRVSVGRDNPLSPGTYFVGVFNDTYPSGDTAYTLESRGIGNGLAIGITNLNFAGAGSAYTNDTGLPGRDAEYFRMVIPANARSWKLRLTPTGGGEALLVVHRGEVPNIGTYLNTRLDDQGKKLRKLDKEHYLLLPNSGDDFIAAGTNYLVVVSEGQSPADYATLGTGSVTYILESLGVAPFTDLGPVPAVGAGIISQHVTIEGGETKLFQFAVSNAADSLELRLENRTGNPTLALVAGTNFPYAGDYAFTFGDDHYGGDGGLTAGRRETHDLISLANPVPGLYSISIKADDYSGFPDAEFDLTITPIGSGTVAFDGGSATVSGHAPNTWRYFTIEVPEDALGWDLRLSGGSGGGSVQMFVRRDQLPAPGAPELNIYGGTWPSGSQLTAYYDWTGGLSEPDSSSVYGRILTVGRGNPLTNGTYHVGVFHGSDAQDAGYTLTSRGLGTGYSIPVGTLAFSGSVSHPGLAPREVAYYALEVPSNAPSWKLKLDTSAGGEARMVVHKDRLPNIASTPSAPTQEGHALAKAGDEQYVLLPRQNETNLDAGTYFIAVVSEGVGGLPGRVGTGTSAFTLQSFGPLPVTALGTVPPPGSPLSHAVALEGAETKAFQYDVPPGVQWMEFRLANRQGNPAFALRRGTEIPHPSVPGYYYNYYGADGGWGSGRSEGFLFQTFVRPEAGLWSLTLKAEYAGGEYPSATNTIEIEQRTPTALVFSNGLVSTSLGDNQRIFYQVTVPPNVLGWKLDLVTSNGTPLVRARKDLLPSDAEPAMAFGGPTVTIVPPFLEPGTWFVEVKGVGSTTFSLRSNPVLLERGVWNMPAFGASVTTTGLPPGGPLFADTGVDTNGVALPTDQGTDLGEGDFHFYVINIPEGNGGLLRAELLAISGNPDLFVRRGGLPTAAHLEFGVSGNILVDFQLTGAGTEYANWVPLNGRTEAQLGPGLWYLGVRANGSNARYRMKLSTGAVANLAAGTVLSGQLIAAGDWRYYRLVLPTNAPQSLTVTYSQQQGDTEMYVRDTVPPGEPFDAYNGYRLWGRDYKNGGPYPSFPDVGSYTLNSPPLRPGHVYYLGFRAVSDASFTVGFTTNAQTIDVTNVIAFYGGVSTVTIPAFSVAEFRVPVPADATSWRHSNTHSGAVQLFLDQGTLPDLSIPFSIWTSYNNPDSQLIQFLYGWPWITNQNYYFVATNTSASAESLTIRMDGRNAVTDDSDGDQLPDGWEILYFGNLNQNGSGDPDGDGINNATELAEGTNPNNAASLRPRLVVNASGAGHTVIEPNLPSYTAGQSVTLTAVPDEGNVFAGWSGDTTDLTSNPLTITMNSNKTITAIFNSTTTPLVSGSLELLANGHFQFTITGPAAAALIIDAVNGLGSPWIPIQTNSPFHGTFVFEDQETGSFSNRFYRVRIP
jgi:hypothetical protein